MRKRQRNRERKDKGTMETSIEDVKTSKVNSRLILQRGNKGGKT